MSSDQEWQAARERYLPQIRAVLDELPPVRQAALLGDALFSVLAVISAQDPALGERMLGYLRDVARAELQDLEAWVRSQGGHA